MIYSSRLSEAFSRGFSKEVPASTKCRMCHIATHAIYVIFGASAARMDIRRVLAGWCRSLDEWLEAEAEVLAPQSLKMVHSVLRRSVSHAQRRGKAVRNAAELVEMSEGRAGRPSRSLSLEQDEAVLRAREGSWIHAYVVLSLLVGVRPEEARPLTWAHIHLAGSGKDKPHVNVWRSVRRHGDTKTRKSRRSPAMPRQAALVTKAHRRREQAELVGHNGSGTTERAYRKQLRPVIAEGAEAMDDIFGDDDDALDGEPPETV